MNTHNNQNNNFLINTISFAACLAFIVILLGAYTRLTDAGLGCPDWPGCYGKIVVPKDVGSNNYGATWEFNSTKAWTEMVHRYLASTLGFLILIISFTTIKKNIKLNKPIEIILPIILLATVIFQGLLGMWTVTLKLLPTVVMGHLIGGLTTLSLLILILLKNFNLNDNVKFSPATKTVCGLALVMVFIQIVLGGWTSSNYAAIPCLDFPSCNGQYFPAENTLSAMNPFISIGPNYEGGVLSNAMRVTIQLFHRWGALITTLLVSTVILSIRQYSEAYYHKFSIYLLFLMGLQITLGIINVKWALPLTIAVMHNGIACLLLISMLVLNYKINYKSYS